MISEDLGGLPPEQALEIIQKETPPEGLSLPELLCWTREIWQIRDMLSPPNVYFAGMHLHRKPTAREAVEHYIFFGGAAHFHDVWANRCQH